MSLLLNAFASNQVIAALVFLPAVSDDFYLINRDRPKLNLRADNILEALTALTNATALRVTFKRPMLLLHLDRDVLEPHLMIRDSATAERLKRLHDLPHALWIDAHWERVQPKLQAALKMSVLPAGGSVEAWHFARHNLAAWNLTDWDLLAALSLTGKTAVSVQKNRIILDENRQ